MSLCDELEVSTVFTDFDVTVCSLTNLQPSPLRRKKKKTEKQIYAEFYEKLCKYSAEIKQCRPHLFNYCQSYIFYSSSIEASIFYSSSAELQKFTFNQPFHFRRFILREGHDHVYKSTMRIFDIIHGLTISGAYISAVTLCFEYEEVPVEISLVRGRNGNDEKWTLPPEIDPLPLMYTKNSLPEHELISFHVQYRDDTVFPQSYEIEFFGLITRNLGGNNDVDNNCI